MNSSVGSPATQRVVEGGSVSELAARLQHWFDPQVEYAIALSGGVDSAVVAKAASESGVRAVTVTARSPSLAEYELLDVQRLLASLAIEHCYLDSQEVSDPRYQRNDHRRCYYCKSQLFTAIRGRFPQATLVTGTNFDDLGDYRPGLQAAQESSVRAPLAEIGLGKSHVRQLAEYWGLHVADKPASPCLASRIAHQVAVTPQRLKMVERGEALLRGWGLTEFRVRLHADDLARIEIAPADFETLIASGRREELVARLSAIGFRYICLDLQGFRSGSLNPLVHIQGQIPLSTEPNSQRPTQSRSH